VGPREARRCPAPGLRRARLRSGVRAFRGCWMLRCCHFARRDRQARRGCSAPGRPRHTGVRPACCHVAARGGSSCPRRRRAGRQLSEPHEKVTRPCAPLAPAPRLHAPSRSSRLRRSCCSLPAIVDTQLLSAKLRPCGAHATQGRPRARVDQRLQQCQPYRADRVPPAR
jgi:hypothetical protein